MTGVSSLTYMIARSQIDPYFKGKEINKPRPVQNSYVAAFGLPAELLSEVFLHTVLRLNCRLEFK